MAFFRMASRCAQAAGVSFIAAAIVALPRAKGAQYFVATTGSDMASGGAAAPWRTLQRAADIVNPGDVVTVRSGAYAGFDLQRSGAVGNPITFFAEPGAVVNQENQRTLDGINLEGASHVVIDGFTVTGVDRAGVRSVGFEDDLAEFVTIRNITATNNGVWGIFTGHVNDLVIENNRTSGSIEEHGIYVSNSGDRPTLRGNESWNNHGSGIHMNGDESEGGDGIISGALVSGNLIYNNAVNGGGGSGINMDGVQNSRIENNLVYGNHASGISLYHEDGAQGSKNNVVVNNSIHQASDGRWALNIQSESTDNTVLNNILVTAHSFRGAIDVSPDSLPGLVSNYNAVVSRFTDDEGDTILDLDEWQQTGQDAQSFVATAAALFVDWPAGDYRLKSGSPAINAGTSQSAPAVDLFGATRPAGAVDIGAIEFGAKTADFNQDGAVNGLDLGAWRTGFGPTSTADADFDGDADGADFLAWQRQSSGAGAAPVPEPASRWIAAIALALWRAVRLLARRRRTERRISPSPRQSWK